MRKPNNFLYLMCFFALLSVILGGCTFFLGLMTDEVLLGSMGFGVFLLVCFKYLEFGLRYKVK